MKHAGIVGLSALLVLGLGSNVGAQAFTEDFEAYEVGSLIMGQGGWETWSGLVESESGVVSDEVALSGSKSLKVTAGNDTVRIFPDVRPGSGCWSLKANVYIPNDHDGTTYFILLNGAERPAPLFGSWDWAMQFAMTGDTISGEGGSLPLVKGDWSLIEVKIDLDNATCEVYYNGNILRAARWWANGPAPLGLEAIDLYSESPRGAYWDDISLQPAPPCDFEPADFGPFGHIQKWLLLGPLVRPDASCPPPIEDMWADYLTDGFDVFQETILPVAGLEMDIDYAAARSTGYHATGRVGPNGLPVWFTWYDDDGGINYNDNTWYNNPDQVMAYAVCYVTNTTGEDMIVDIGTSSDDAIEIWQDGIILNSVLGCRGWAWPNDSERTATLLKAGVKHRIMTKTFEAGGGFNFYLRFVDRSTGNPITSGIEVSLDPTGIDTAAYPVREPGQGTTPDGWITEWLVLGELMHRGTHAPSLRNLFRDYITDGAIDDILVKPMDGDEVEIDYCGAALAGSFDAGSSRGDADGNGYPEWFWQDGTAWRGLDYSAIFGDRNDVVTYAVAYLVNPTDQPIRAILGTTSDDSIISYVNTTAITWANLGRGWANVPQEYGVATLLPGKNKLLVKCWEGGGGHGIRAKIVNAAVTVTSDPTGCIVPDFGVRRVLPREAQAGGVVPVRITGVGVGSGAVTETVPAGWAIVDPAGGTVVGQEITWPSLAAGEAITYRVRAPIAPAGLVRFDGVYSVGGGPAMSVFGDLLIDTGTPPVADPSPFGTNGLIRRWLILGPIGDQRGCDIGPTEMLRDYLSGYLTDGTAVNELEILPYAGMEVDIDFANNEGDVYYGRRGASGLPVWHPLLDNDGGINYNDEHMPGMQNDNVMAYAVCYVKNTTGADMQVWFGTGSDDALVVWFDDTQNYVMDTCRGWAFPNPQEVNGPVTLEAGVQHRIMTKTFEQGGGWNFYLRLQDAGGNPITSGVEISLESELNPPPAMGTRELPDFAATGGTVPVTITVRGSGTTDIVENVPAGWAISNVSGGGVVVDQTITWSGVGDGAVLTYDVTAPDSVRAGVFSGSAVGDTTIQKVRPNDSDPSVTVKDVFGPQWGAFEILGADSVNIWGSGGDIWGTADEFRFVYIEAEGDFQVTALVPHLDYTHDWAKAGVMIRTSACPDAAYALMCVTPTQGNDLQFRLTRGAGAGNRGNTGGAALVRWVRLVKEGSTITGYRSADGIEWIQHGDPLVVDWADPVLVGLAVTSHNRGAVAGAEFREVEFRTLGTPFIRGDTDGNGVYTLGDGIQILERIFVGRMAFDSDCEDTGDVDDDGVFTIGDAIWVFNYLFGEPPLKKPPYPPADTCGLDPTPETTIGCNQVPPACR